MAVGTSPSGKKDPFFLNMARLYPPPFLMALQLKKIYKKKNAALQSQVGFYHLPLLPEYANLEIYFSLLQKKWKKLVPFFIVFREFSILVSVGAIYLQTVIYIYIVSFEIIG